MSDREQEFETNVWRQRREQSASAPWGWAYEVATVYGEPIAQGWRSTQEAAFRAVDDAIERHKTKTKEKT